MEEAKSIHDRPVVFDMKVLPKSMTDGYGSWWRVGSVKPAERRPTARHGRTTWSTSATRGSIDAAESRGGPSARGHPRIRRRIPMSKKLKIGIIGAGRIGKLHANNLVNRVPDAELVGRVGRLCARGEGAGRKAEHPQVVRRLPQDSRGQGHRRGVHLLVDGHALPISIEAARAGKHIFCEKPIDHDLDKIKVVLDEVERAGVKYQVGFNRRV